MIDRYTIKFGPAVSQKELEKALSGELSPEEVKKVHLLKARIEVLGTFDDLQKIDRLLKQLAKSDEFGGG